jgi:hypothetical protein
MKKAVKLDDAAWGQVVDGLTCRAELYENTIDYYEGGFVEGEVAIVRDAAEARCLANWYRRIIEDIRRQLRDG